MISLCESESNNDLEMVQLLLKKGVDPNTYDKSAGDCGMLWDLRYEADDSWKSQS